MASIFKIGPFSHLRADPNEHILHYRRGRLIRQGPGLAYWFNSLSAAIAQVPVEDCETTFMLRERTSDFQEVAVQCTLVYRISNPEAASARLNFTLILNKGVWKERPLERLANYWSQRVQQPARSYLTTVPVVEAVQNGAEKVRQAIRDSLDGDEELIAMGLTVVDVQIIKVAPMADLEKALQTPTREAIQQKADEAVFERRAMAVEKERAIKENELATQIELAKQREHLIEQEGANRLRQVRQEAEAEKTKLEAELDRGEQRAKAEAEQIKVRTAGEAEAKGMLATVEAEADAKRVAVWKEAPSRVILGLALQGFAEHIQQIQHLNVTPDLLSQALTQFAQDQADR